jgi:hypothetical protein
MRIHKDTWTLACVAALSIFVPYHCKAKCIEIFDSTAYKNKPDMKAYGIRKAITADILKWWSPEESKDALTRSDGPERWAKGPIHGDIVVLDIEQWPTRDPKLTPAVTLPQMTELAQRLRSAKLHLPIGYYAVLPVRDYWRAVKGPESKEYIEWQRENDLLKPLAKEVDALFPSLYTFYDEVDGWKRYARANLSEARRLSSGKPIYALLWPEYHNSNKKLAGQFVPGEYWAAELRTVAEMADGVIVWGGWNNGPRPWDENAPWWAATKTFIAEQTTACSSTRIPKPPDNLELDH